MSFSNNYPTVGPVLNLDFINNEALDPRVSFTRATTATYYNGVTTAVAEQNLLLRSQEFDNAVWDKGGSTVTANSATAPDGTTTAELLAETATTAFHYIELNSGSRTGVVSGFSYAFSIFLKKGSGATAPDIMQLTWGGAGFGSTIYANFNLSTGAVTASGAGATATIQDFGGGWYRCSFVATANATTGNSTLALSFVNNNSTATRFSGTYLGATTADVFIWGAQLEQRSAVTAYTPTTTQAITNYIPVLLTAQNNVPRFDHNPTTGVARGLLIEEQRTNSLTYSSEFDNAAWTKTATAITANTIVAPDGTLTGDKLVENTANSEHSTQQVFSFTSGTSYSSSVYVKAAERTIIRFGAANTATYAAAAFFDLSTGTVASVSAGTASIQSVGNGWYRCVVTGTAGATTATNVRIGLVSTGTTLSYTGDGYSGIYIWGAQLEAGAFATSYIPTTTTALTRNADVADMTGTNFSSWYSASEGTFVFNGVTNAATGGFLTADNGSVANYMRFSRGFNKANFLISNTSGTQADLFSVADITLGTQFKLAGTYKVNDAALSLNGAAAVTDTLVTLPDAADRLRIGFGLYTTYLNGYIQRIAYYNYRVPNAQLQALTGV